MFRKRVCRDFCGSQLKAWLKRWLLLCSKERSSQRPVLPHWKRLELRRLFQQEQRKLGLLLRPHKKDAEALRVAFVPCL